MVINNIQVTLMNQRDHSTSNGYMNIVHHSGIFQLIGDLNQLDSGWYHRFDTANHYSNDF